MTKDDVFIKYASYLANCISEIRFFDKEKLAEYLKTHLGLFYSECLDDHLLPDLNVRRNYLIIENQKLLLEKINIENQILSYKSALYVDAKWLSTAKYNLNIKGIQMFNNNAELKKISEIIKRTQTQKNIESANTEDRKILNIIKTEIGKRYGKDAMIDIFNSCRDKIYKQKQ